MHNLEQLIAEWRKTMMTAHNIGRETLDELENHLRENVDQLVQSGMAEPEAFQRAVTQLGGARTIASEFQKLDQPTWLPVKVITGIGIMAALGWALLLIVRFDTGRLSPAGQSCFHGDARIHDHISHRRAGDLLCGPALFFRFLTVAGAFPHARHFHARLRCGGFDRGRTNPWHGLGQGRMGAVLGVGCKRNRRVCRNCLAGLLLVRPPVCVSHGPRRSCHERSRQHRRWSRLVWSESAIRWTP